MDDQMYNNQRCCLPCTIFNHDYIELIKKKNHQQLISFNIVVFVHFAETNLLRLCIHMFLYFWQYYGSQQKKQTNPEPCHRSELPCKQADYSVVWRCIVKTSMYPSGAFIDALVTRAKYTDAPPYYCYYITSAGF